jgi:hypothetical protein
MFAIRPKVRRFKPGQADGFLWAIKIRSIPPFGQEIKPETPFCKEHVKYHLHIQKKCFARPNSSFLSPNYPP